MSFSRQVGRSAIWAIVGQGTTAVMSLINFAVVGRFVSPNEYGSFLLAMMVLTGTQWLAMNAYKEPVVQAKELTNSLINSVFTFSVMVGAVLCAVMLGVALYLERGGETPGVGMCIVVLALKLLIDTAMSVPNALRVRQLDFRFLARVSIMANVASTVVNVSLLFLGFGMLSLVISQLVTSLLSAVALLYTGKQRYALRWHRADLLLLKGYSPHVIMWQLMEALGQTVDRFFIASRLTLADLGLYGFGKRLNDVIIEVLVGATSNVSLPAFSQMQDDRQRLQAAFLKAVRLVTMMVLPLIAALWVTADDFVPLLFGPKWEQAVPVYRWFLLLGIIQTIGILQGGLLRSMWKPGVWTRYQVMQVVANIIVLSMVAGQSIEVIAAAIVIRAYVLWGWVVYQVCKALHMKFRFYALQLLRPVSLALLSAAAGYAVRHYVVMDWNLLLRLIAGGLVVVATFITLVMLLYRTAADELLSIVKNVISRTKAA
ncbi:oligosaccharide flippase family protein [Duganella phyllosphaerae]|uniref:Lipopolysaccharide biosynthesis protein WzxC n=1 Tax=Duganella phyllosphaerae TaxID=762836 RepID=A0A1E7X193_9BURK|nr:oligosaccharide flippase family protein [Duganella phyllosphaerae]OFA05946.1 lipopolysaccharide biosynthesis protein WzxC [Duganella phyllosphaerae]